jgi:hypothetical protein
METIQCRIGNDLATLARYPPFAETQAAPELKINRPPGSETECLAQTRSNTEQGNTSPTMPPSGRSLQLSGLYYAFLVRMWQEHPESPWRASAQNAQTGEKQMFANLEQLVAFLYAQTRTEAPPPSSPVGEP